MAVTARKLMEIKAEDKIRFGIVSAFMSLHFHDELSKFMFLDIEGEHMATPRDVEALYDVVNRWCNEIPVYESITFMKPDFHRMNENVTASIFTGMFVYWVAGQAHSKSRSGLLSGSLDKPLRLNPHESMMINGLMDFEQYIPTMEEGFQQLRENGASTLERKDEIISSVVWRQFNNLYTSDMNDKKLLRSAERKARKAEAKVDELQKQLDIAMKPKEVIKVEKVRDTETEDALYEELREARQKLALLEDKVAIYESQIAGETYELMEELYVEQQEQIDLSKYKILIVGSYENKDAYPFPYIECHSDTAILSKCRYVDYVLFDTRVNSHHTYFATKQVCKSAGVKMFHINNRNRDTILSEAKRLISAVAE